MFIQRDPVSKTGALSFDGDQARVVKNGVVIVDWTTGGRLTGIPQGDGYTLEVMKGSAVTTQPLAVGIVIAALGQSNMGLWTREASAYTRDASAYLLKADGTMPGITGTAARVFTSLLTKFTGAPIGFVDSTSGGTSLLPENAKENGDWSSNAPGSLYARALANIALTQGDPEFVLWSQGETDQNAKTEAYAPALRNFFERLNADLDTPSVIIMEIGPKRAVGSLAQTAQTYAAVRTAQQQVAAEMDNVVIGAVTVDGELQDAAHLDAVTRAVAAAEMAMVILDQMGLGGQIARRSGSAQGETINGGSGVDYI